MSSIFFSSSSLETCIIGKQQTSLIAKWQLEIKVSAGDKHHRAVSIPSHFMAKDQDHQETTKQAHCSLMHAWHVCCQHL
jgi:hypothetical protein